MEDITIGGPEPWVASDIKHISTNDGTIGPNWNFIKSEHKNKSSALTFEPLGQFPHYTINNANYLAHLSYQVLQWTQP